MNLLIQSIELKNFKGHADLTVDLSDLTKITGKNGEGKSTIGDAVPFVLFGTDSTGTQMDPKPIFDFEGDIIAKLIIHTGTEAVELIRSVEGGKNKFYLNETPVAATAFKSYVESLFDKELFLSLYNPTFFSSQHWKKQREQLLTYISEPVKKEVFAEMADVTVKNIEEPLKKHSLTDLEKIHRDRFNKRDKELERAGERVLTLKEQLEKAEGSTDIRPLQKEYQELNEKLKAAKEQNAAAQKAAAELQELNVKEKFYRDLIKKQKESIEQINAEPIADVCECCGQAIPADQAAAHRVEKINRMKNEGKQYVAELREIAAKREGMQEPAEPVDVSEIMNRMAELKAAGNEIKRLNGLEDEIKAAEDNRETIRMERNESQGIIDAIKEFNEKKALLMVDKVNALFTTLSVKLFDQQKNGEFKHTFEIEMDGKPYSALSTAEKIKAGLELIEVLQQQSGITVPTFVDNAESIINFTSPTGQLITAAVKNNKLKIEKAGANND